MEWIHKTQLMVRCLKNKHNYALLARRIGNAINTQILHLIGDRQFPRIGGHLTNCHCGSGFMPITLSWHVTMSTDRIPHTSWIILLTTRVDPTIGVRTCSSNGPSGVWDGWPLCRMPAMSVNPSRGAHGMKSLPWGWKWPGNWNCELL